jgi:predicted alpha/beta superfamily hydrolase
MARRGALSLLTVALISVAATAGVEGWNAPPVATPVACAEQVDLPSHVSGRTYRIYIRKPDHPPPAAGWPVLIVTDGNMIFPVASAIAPLSTLDGSHDTLIVGVGYPVDDLKSLLSLRNRDLTPETPVEGLRFLGGQPEPKAEDYGGAELFYRFLTEELRPWLASHYATDGADQTLYGHSLGGLFTLGVLFSHPEAFRTYVASSPSIWWNHRAVLAGETEFSRRVRTGAIAPRILLFVGGQEQSIVDPLPPGVTREQLEESIHRTRMVDNAVELADRLVKLQGPPGYHVGFQRFEGEGHVSVIPASLSRALMVMRRQ